MSALEFQKALAQLIRYPDLDVAQAGRSWQEELSVPEQATLLAASKDPLVIKYAKKMQFVRHREAMSILRFSKQVIPTDVLDSIYFDLFEPTRKTTDSLWLGVEFLHFVLSRQDCLETLRSRSPDWGIDCLTYENAKAYVTRQVPTKSDPSLPLGSLLRYASFRIVELSFDIPEFELKWVQSGLIPEEITRRPLILLFIPSHESPFYRMFEIDTEIGEFLKVQRDDPAGWHKALPSCYEGMQGVGLVQ